MKHASSYVVLIVAFMLSATVANVPNTDNDNNNNNNAYAQQTESTKISLSIVPPKVPADGDSYDIIYVAIMDSKGSPSVVSDKLEVRLTSSTTSIGIVEGTTTIEAGNYYTIATFRSTETAGSATISATAVGYASAQASVTTVKSSDRNAVKLNVIALPSPPLPQEGAEGIVIVQLLNSVDLPAVANEDIKVSLTSSNESVINVDKSVTIPKGQIYAIAKSETALGSGQSTITASADGLVFGTATISTSDTTAGQLKVYPLPPTISTKGTDGGWVVVQLEDLQGMPVRSSADIEVSLFSSDDRILLPKDSTVVIRKAQSFAFAKIVPGGNEGKASITPLAGGFLSVSGDISAVQPTFDAGERQIALYSAPPNIDPAATDRVLVLVQIQSQSGTPAPVFRTTKVQLVSSNLNVGKFNDNLIIVPSDSFAISSLSLVGLTGDTTITASAANFQTKQLKIAVQGRAGSGVELIPTSQNIPAYNAPYPALLVMLQSGNIPLKAPTDINVMLSANSDLASIPRTVKIPKGESFTVVNITPKGFPGALTITAKADGFKDSIKTITMTEFSPSILAVFTAFPTLLPSSSEGDKLVVVQLQNSKGEPEKNMVSDTEVSLSIFPSNIGTVEQNFVIPRGANFASAKVFLNTVQGDGTVNVNAEGYKLVSTRFKTVSFTLNAALSVEPSVIDINQTATLMLKVTSNNKPVSGAKVNWQYDEGSAVLSSVSDTTNPAGEATAIYTPRKDIAQQVTAVVTKPGYIQKESTLTFDLGDKVKTTGAGRPQFSAEMLSILLVVAIVAEGFVIYRFYQKKRPLF